MPKETQIQATGLAPPNNLEAAILVTPLPGAYTVFLQGKAMTTGIALAEVYDVDPNVNAQPTNLSARAFVGTGSDVLIGVRSSAATPEVCTRPRACARPIARERREQLSHWLIRRSHCTMPTETSSPAMTTGRIRSSRTLLRPVRHRRTIMNWPSSRRLRRETTLPSLPGKNVLMGVALIEFYSLP